MRRCLTCTALIGAGSRCRNCQRAERNRQNAERGGSGWAWQRIRAQALDRDMHMCQQCGRAATEVDHVVPLHRGGTNELRNLRSLCTEHHQAKTNKDRRA